WQPRQRPQFHQRRVALLLVSQALAEMPEDDPDGLDKFLRGWAGGQCLDATSNGLKTWRSRDPEPLVKVFCGRFIRFFAAFSVNVVSMIEPGATLSQHM